MGTLPDARHVRGTNRRRALSAFLAEKPIDWAFIVTKYLRKCPANSLCLNTDAFVMRPPALARVGYGRVFAKCEKTVTPGFATTLAEYVLWHTIVGFNLTFRMVRRTDPPTGIGLLHTHEMGMVLEMQDRFVWSDFVAGRLPIGLKRLDFWLSSFDRQPLKVGPAVHHFASWRRAPNCTSTAMKHPDLEATIPLPLQRYAQVRDPCWHFSKHVVLRPIANVSVEQLTHMFGSKGVSPRMCALSFSSAAGAQRACEGTPGCGGVNFMRPVICPVANPAAGTADPLFTLPWPTSRPSTSSSPRSRR